MSPRHWRSLSLFTMVLFRLFSVGCMLGAVLSDNTLDKAHWVVLGIFHWLLADANERNVERLDEVDR